MLETEKSHEDPAVPVTADAATQTRVKQWSKRVRMAREHYEKTVFKRMRECMQLAKDGADKTWVDADKYVVPIINRHINQSVSQLYARNPKAYAKRKARRMFTVWDGQMASLQEAAMLFTQTVQAGQQAQMAQAAQPGVPVPPPPQIDPNVAAVLQDAMSVKQYDLMMDGLAETMTLLHNHYMQDKAAQYKQQFKALVRRVKVCCAGYVKLGFQRQMETDPEVIVKLDDVTRQIETNDRLMAENAREPLAEDAAELAQLKTMLADLQSQQDIIVQEGPVLSFPRPTRIIIDPACQHLKTLAGADWWAEEIDMTPERIEEVYQKNVRGQFEAYQTTDDNVRRRVWEDKSADGKAEHKTAKVWIIQDRPSGQEFTICDGYPDFLRGPAPPEVRISRFFTLFPLVFNEIEDEDDLFPPSDVWNARHIQKEYNRSRQGLRAHRIANRPGYLAGAGSFSNENDLDKLRTHGDSEIILVNQLAAGDDIRQKIQAKPVMEIRPEMYEVESHYADLQRTVGSQQANLGGTSGDTATETSIAEQSRSVQMSDNVDDLDDMLSLLAHSIGELCLAELSLETVQKIVGPGAVWPQDPQSRAEIAGDITLDIRAGSSGRPNQAAEVAKLERALPYLLQLPNVNPIPIVQRYTDLLELDAESAILEGMPSITALNSLMTKPQQPPPGGAGAGQDPKAQGGHGGDNAPKPGQNEQQSQPAYPTANPQQPGSA